jgi:hypothetical protein
MRKWMGEFGSASLPADIEDALRQRSRNVLGRYGVSDEVIDRVVSALVHEVSWACAGREYKLDAEGRGRPASVAALLSVNVADLLKKEGLRGNWLQLGDDKEHGPIGLVAELEAIAQTAFRQATHRLQRHLGGELPRQTELEKVVCSDESAGQSKQAGVMARPARISKARRILGKVFRT